MSMDTCCRCTRVLEIFLICRILEIPRFHRGPDDDETAKRLDEKGRGLKGDTMTNYSVGTLIRALRQQIAGIRHEGVY
jgi:hypothetical protein